MNLQYYNSQLPLFPEPFCEIDKTVIRNGVKFYMHHAQSIPKPAAYKYLQYYKLLYWSGHHTLESIEAGMIVRDNTAFIVRYHNGLTRGKILAKPDAQYRISFRAAKDFLCIDPIVLISESPTV